MLLKSASCMFCAVCCLLPRGLQLFDCNKSKAQLFSADFMPYIEGEVGQGAWCLYVLHS